MTSNNRNQLVVGIYKFDVEEKAKIKIKPEQIIYTSLIIGIIVLILHILYPI